MGIVSKGTTKSLAFRPGLLHGEGRFPIDSEPLVNRRLLRIWNGGPSEVQHPPDLERQGCGGQHVGRE